MKISIDFLLKTKKQNAMIYFTNIDNERYSIHKFFSEKRCWQSYLILVIINQDEQMLMAKQIHRSHLDDEVNWLLTSKEGFLEVQDQYKEYPFQELFVMEITMTGNKSDVIFAHNWNMLSIEHTTKNDPFDDAMSKVINDCLDQLLYNFANETKTHQKKLQLLLVDFMASGVFQMLPSPTKILGN